MIFFELPLLDGDLCEFFLLLIYNVYIYILEKYMSVNFYIFSTLFYNRSLIISNNNLELITWFYSSINWYYKYYVILMYLFNSYLHASAVFKQSYNLSTPKISIIYFSKFIFNSSYYFIQEFLVFILVYYDYDYYY